MNLFMDNCDKSLNENYYLPSAKAMQFYVEQADHVYLDVTDVADVLPIHRVMDWGMVENGTANSVAMCGLRSHTKLQRESKRYLLNLSSFALALPLSRIQLHSRWWKICQRQGAKKAASCLGNMPC